MSQVTIKYVDGEGTEVVTPLAEAKATLIADGLPVRSFGSYAGMRHYPGWWWSATTASLLPYESLLERDRLLAADFDRDVVAIASQPFGLTARVGGANRHHVPDFLLIGRDGTPTVVDVKPARLAAKPDVVEVLEWTGTLLHQRGWRYEVWSGLTPTLQENLRFIAAGRHTNRVDPEALSLLERQEADGRTIREVLDEVVAEQRCDRRFVTAAALAMLWRQAWRVDLEEPLSHASVIQRIGVMGDARAGT